MPALTPQQAVGILSDPEFWAWAADMPGMALGELFALGGYCSPHDPMVAVLNLAGTANTNLSSEIGRLRFELSALPVLQEKMDEKEAYIDQLVRELATKRPGKARPAEPTTHLKY